MPSHPFGLACLLLTLTTGGAEGPVVLTPVHYDLNIEVDFEAEVLRATARLDLRNTSTMPVREVSLLLYRLFQVRAVVDDRGRDLEFTQAVVAFEDFARQQVNHVLVTLPEPLDPEGRATIRVRYDGHLLGYAETGMRYIQDRIDTAFTILRDDAYAYPLPGVLSTAANRSVATPAFTYSARITVPKGLTVANGGRLEGADTVGQSVTFRYSSLKPSWRMDFAIARFTEVASGAVRVFHLPGDEAGASGVGQAAAEALARYTSWFGPRPEPAPLTFIEIPDGWGSQADVTTIIQSAAAFTNPRFHGEVYHEIAHLWSVEASERPSPRWEEGLASFLEDLVTEEVTGTPTVAPRADRLVEWLRGQLPTHRIWRSVPLVEYGQAGLTDLSYSVGHLYFALLYRLAGPETFNRIIGGFAAEFGTGGGTTQDLSSLVSLAAAADFGPLNDDWLFTVGWADRIAQHASLQELEAIYRRPRRE